MIAVRIRFFAGHREIVGKSEQTLMVQEGATADDVWHLLARQYPALAPYRPFLRCAVNQTFCDLSRPLQAGDEIAYIPPVSGGSGGAHLAEHPGENGVEPFVLTDAPLDPCTLLQSVPSATDGAVVLFSGVVRGATAGRAVDYLTYEAYGEMVIPVLVDLAEEAQARFSIGKVAVHHRIGRVEIGGTVVLVAVAAPHRHDAFAAAAYLMDRIKDIVPIWKCEHWSDGSHTWRDQAG
jgi:molybdopterin synthase catalytic subunit